METRRMCPHCRAFIKTSDRVCPYCEAEVGPRAVDRRQPGEILGGLIPHTHFTTTIILLINLGLFAATVIFSMRAGNSEAILGIDGQTLTAFGAKRVDYIALAHQWWRLITAGFLHGGILHIFMNGYVLLYLGPQVEEIYGAARLLVIYFLATVFGFYASAVWSPAMSVGASAGLFGLLGAMIAVGVRHRNPMGAAIRRYYISWVVWGVVMGLLPGFAVDNAAHLGGLAAGFISGYAAGTPKLIHNWVEWFWRVSAYLCVFVTAYAFLRWFLWFLSTTG